MKNNTRFIKSIIQTAEAEDVVMPWTRGKNRRSFIERRAQQEKKERKTA